MPRPNRVQYWRSAADRQWYVREIAPNGEVLTSSEGHVRRIDAEHLARSIAPAGTEPQLLEVEPS